jgi:hypothetical protein
VSCHWIYLDAPGSRRGTSEPFDTQEAAEEWIGEEWSRLLAEGVLGATLVCEDEELYTMKLTAD